MHALILAGGEGMRLRPLTANRPKPLVEFMGRPFAQGLLRRLADVGCHVATFLVGADPRPFAGLGDAGRAAGVDVSVLPERRPLDTAGAVRNLVRGGGATAPVLVCNGDILTDLDYAALLRAHQRAGAAATVALTRVEDPSSYGLVVTDRRGRVLRFVEKPPEGAGTVDTVNAGTYVLVPRAFDGFPGSGRLSFERDVFPALVAVGDLAASVSPAYWLDIGTPQRYLAGHRAVLEGHCAWPTAEEVRPGPPGSASVVDDTAVVDPDAALGPGAVVGAGCLVAGGATVRHAVLHERVRVEAEAVVDGAVLAPGVVVGARALVGPGSVVADGVRVPDGAVVAAGAPSG
ncbi:MAG: NDP-sugar synthase [Actinobacteria bacterium]|nr:NDP-sugar synthase [Actinomycetota bacterium]